MIEHNLKLGKFMTNQVANTFGHVRWPSVISTPDVSEVQALSIFVALQKLWKMVFISSKKLPLSSRYSIFSNFFPSFPHFPDSKGEIKVKWFTMSWIDLHKLADVIFGITQKPHYITSSNLVR